MAKGIFIMNLKKTVLYIIIVYLIVIIFSIALKPYKLGGNEELIITRWNYALDEIEPNKTKISYSVFLNNESKGNIFIRTIKPEYRNEILNDIEYDNVIILNKEIMPKDVLEVSWDIMINKKGLTVKEIKGFLTSISLNAIVKGENVISHGLITTYYNKYNLSKAFTVIEVEKYIKEDDENNCYYITTMDNEVVSEWFQLI